MARKLRISVALSALTFALAALSVASTPQELEGIAQLGAKNVETLKAPEFGKSRCLLSPDFGADYVSVAISADRSFFSGDVLLSIAGEALDPTSKSTIRDVLLKHGPDETVPVKLKRASEEITVNAKCMDAKPYFDRVLEAAFAASKKDMAGCADKMDEAAKLHTLTYQGSWLRMQCKIAANKLTGADASRAYYDVEKQGIEELSASADALDHARVNILTAIDTLHKNQAGFLADDLKELFDKAVANASVPPAASNH